MQTTPPARLVRFPLLPKLLLASALVALLPSSRAQTATGDTNFGTALLPGIDPIDIGISPTGTGTLIVDSDMALGFDVNIGLYGNGTAVVTAGMGLVSDTVTIGRYSGSTGLLKNVGDATSYITHFYVGYGGNGTLEVSDLGSFTASETILGYQAGSTGVVTVTGGSLLTDTTFTVGRNGNGTLDISGGVVTSRRAAHIGSYGSGDNGTGLVRVSGGIFRIEAVPSSGPGNLDLGYFGGQGTLQVSGSGSVQLDGSITLGALGAGLIEISGNGSVSAQHLWVHWQPQGTGTLQVSGGTLSLRGELVNGGRAEITGGTVTSRRGWTGDNGYPSWVKVSGGSWLVSEDLAINGLMQVSGTGAVSAQVVNVGWQAPSASPLLQVSGGTLTSSGAMSVNGTVEVSGTGTVSASSVLVGTNYWPTFPGTFGTVSLLGGTLTTGQISRGNLLGTVTFDGGTLRLSGNQSALFASFQNGDVALAGLGGTVDTQAYAVATSLGLSGAGALTKTGSGTLTLAGTNTYTGATNVSAGTLLVNGSLANTTVTVANGATLGGSGSLGGLATIASGATLAPGNSPGTLTFTNGLTLSNGAILDFQLGTTSDLIAVTGGTLTGSASAGGITLNLSDSGGFTPATYTLFDFTGATVSSFDLSDFTLGTTIPGYTYSLGFSGETLQLTAVSAVPEPSTYAAFAGLGALGFVCWRRRRRTV